MLTGTTNLDESVPASRDVTTLSWAGADNPNHFFTTQELFDGNKTQPWPAAPVGFTNRISEAGTNVSSYDRYTFYRMLGQLGMDTAPERGKLNVNYKNVDARGNILPGLETNMFAWKPLEFFTNAANRLIWDTTSRWRDEDFRGFTNTFGVTEPFGVTNIPVFVSYTYTDTGGRLVTNNIYGYTPAIHRLLQVVANIYDAAGDVGTPDSLPLANQVTSARQLYAPHVYRPVFRRDVNNRVFIRGFQEVVNASDLLPRLWGAASPAAPAPFPVDLADPVDRASLPDMSRRLARSSASASPTASRWSSAQRRGIRTSTGSACRTPSGRRGGCSSVGRRRASR